MAYIGRVRRWDAFWADLEPAIGSEQGGARRPVVIVSNDRFNAAMNAVTVLPLTKLEGSDGSPTHSRPCCLRERSAKGSRAS